MADQNETTDIKKTDREVIELITAALKVGYDDYNPYLSEYEQINYLTDTFDKLEQILINTGAVSVQELRS